MLKEIFFWKIFNIFDDLDVFRSSWACNAPSGKATKGLGRTFRNSGSPLGLVRLEHDYVAGVGDIDHPNTFPFESCPAIVPGLTFEEAQHGSQDPKILEKLKCVVKEMEAENCFGIAGNCGFMHFYQQFVRDYATVPVFMSALVQVPLMAAALEPDERTDPKQRCFFFGCFL